MLYKGGLTGALALFPLYSLLTECGLEFEGFYEELLALLTPRVFYEMNEIEVRTRFIGLLEMVLGSQHLKAEIVQRFLKTVRCLLYIV